jgi:hypothetical protein
MRATMQSKILAVDMVDYKPPRLAATPQRGMSFTQPPPDPEGVAYISPGRRPGDGVVRTTSGNVRGRA